MAQGELLINLSAVERNFLQFRSHLPEKTAIAPVIKANGYGIGAKKIADHLAPLGASLFVVLSLDEAKEIAPHKALVLHPREEEIEPLLSIGAHLTISSLKLLSALKGKCASLHLHLNSGMNRLGLSFEELITAAEMLRESPELLLEGLMTHFAASDLPEEDSFSKRQMQEIKAAKRELIKRGLYPHTLHIANSFGALRFPDPDFNLARIGLALYGVSSPELSLEGALTLSSEIVQIHQVERGESVSYGRRYIAEERRQIAVVPVGYYDGLPRSFSNCGVVLIGGVKAPIVGSVCMDFFLTDVTDVPRAQIGSRVTLFGTDELGNYLSPEEAALKGGTIAHELIARLGPRILRRFENLPFLNEQFGENLSTQEILR